jgi:methionyl-tRNA formyltransferase
MIFMGTPEFALPSLNALITAGHEICAVYTQPPRRAGRGKSLTPTPVHARAEVLGLPVFTPTSLKDEAEQLRFAAFGADVAVVAAYGLLLPRAVLDAPLHGCINVHGSILPRWRGAAPVQRAILAGDRETGVTIMQMEAGLDTGPMRAFITTPIDVKTAGTLMAELAEIGAKRLVEVLADLPAFPPMPQPADGVTHAAKIDKSEARLDFLISATQVERQIRAFAPAPGAFFELGGERFRVLSVDVLPPAPQQEAPGTVVDDQLTIACNPGAVRPTLIQRAGKSAMSVAELLRGFPIPAGTKLA